MKEVIKVKSWIEDSDWRIEFITSVDEVNSKILNSSTYTDVFYEMPITGEKKIIFNYETCRFEKIETSSYKVELI